MKLYSKDSGSIVLEAALIMPLFLVFVLALITVIKISIIDIALYSAVSETTKQIAVHMYPVDLLYQEYESSKTGQAIDQFVDNIITTRKKVMSSEQWINHYSFLIPEPLLEVVKWELDQRNSLESALNDKYNQALNRVFKPVLFFFVDVNARNVKKINTKQLTIEKVTLPNFADRSQAIIGIEAKYKLTLPLPFFRTIIYIRKRSLERAWVGA